MLATTRIIILIQYGPIISNIIIIYIPINYNIMFVHFYAAVYTRSDRKPRTTLTHTRARARRWRFVINVGGCATEPQVTMTASASGTATARTMTTGTLGTVTVTSTTNKWTSFVSRQSCNVTRAGRTRPLRHPTDRIAAVPDSTSRRLARLAARAVSMRYQTRN